MYIYIIIYIWLIILQEGRFIILYPFMKDPKEYTQKERDFTLRTFKELGVYFKFHNIIIINCRKFYLLDSLFLLLLGSLVFLVFHFPKIYVNFIIVRHYVHIKLDTQTKRCGWVADWWVPFVYWLYFCCLVLTLFGKQRKKMKKKMVF